MNKLLEKILLIFLIMQPFLDVVATTKYNILNIGIRGLFVIFITLYLLIKKKSIKLLIFTLVLCLILLITNIYLKRGIIPSISNIMKLYYLPLTIIFFTNISGNINNKYLTYVLCIYLGLFILSYLFGFGYDNYTLYDGKSGFRGIFNSINEISAIIIGLLPVVLDDLKSNKKYIISIVLIISTLLVALLTGTKVLMIGLFIIILFIYFKDIMKKFKSMTKSRKILSVIIAILIITIGIYLLTYTRFYKNMIIQQKFFKVDNIFSIDFINRVLFNNRLTFLKNNFNYYIHKNIIQLLFGIGYNNEAIKLVEIDIFDILFRFGIIGFISFIIPILFVIKRIKMKIVPIFSMIMLILISLTSGHVLLSPSVSIYFGYLVLQKK